jgi:hypothetical protein
MYSPSSAPIAAAFNHIRVTFKHTNLPSKGSAETELLRFFALSISIRDQSAIGQGGMHDATP